MGLAAAAARFVYSNSVVVVAGSNYMVTVGAGGLGPPATTSKGNNGSNSVFGAITGIGGGGGGSDNGDINGINKGPRRFGCGQPVTRRVGGRVSHGGGLAQAGRKYWRRESQSTGSSNRGGGGGAVRRGRWTEQQ